MIDVPQTSTCLSNLESALVHPLSFRIGGTTQDRALYDGEQKAPSSYKLQPGVHVPKQLTFGSNFIELAASLKGPTTLGLNRESNNFTNVAEAIAQALLKMDNLYAFELGNEPEFWDQRSPAAGGRPWNPQADAASQILWQEKISQLTLRKPLVQAGVFLSPPRWSISELAPLQANHAQYVKSFGGHAYPQSACGRSSASLVDLMSHSKIVRFVNRFRAEVDAAARLNKPYHLSETNSATCGGDGISVTFGAGLWIIDYVMQSIILGVHRVYFHQGTVNHSPYSFWDQSKVSPAFYGAYFAALALRGATQISYLPTPGTEVGAYAFWRCKQLIRFVVYNSEYFSGKGPRRLREIKLPGIPTNIKSARLLRFTDKNARAFVTDTNHPFIGKAYFDNKTCKLSAPVQYEEVHLQQGGLSFSINASEAVLIELDNDVISC